MAEVQTELIRTTLTATMYRRDVKHGLRLDCV